MDESSIRKELAKTIAEDSVENTEKYAKQLNGKLEFPVIGYYTFDIEMFGKKRIQIEIEKII